MTARLKEILLLFIATTGCRPEPAPAPAPALLAAAHRAMGETDSIRNIWAVASVASPSGGFEARIASTTSGDVRLALGAGLIAGVRAGSGWSCNQGAAGPLDPVLGSVVRGHDLHMLIVSPSWMKAPTRERDRRWGNDSVMTLGFVDELGAPLLMHLRVTDSLPVGLDVINHTGSGPREVRVLLDDWQVVSGIRLFRSAVFEHGGNKFSYSYRELAINSLPDSALAPACEARQLM